MNVDVSLAIGISSLVLSIVLYLLSAISERRNRKVLSDINDAIQKWQTKIMDSAIELMESRPEISGKRAAETDSKTKADFINELSQRIKFIIENQHSSDAAVTQSANLQILLDFYTEITKSTVPKEAWDEILKSTINKQTNTSTSQQNTKDQ
jgi:hypothetical protein